MLQSSNKPETTLKKKHVNIPYHMSHEQIAAIVQTGDNVANTTTNILEGIQLQHLNKVLFALTIYTEHQIKLFRMRIWYETIHKT